MKYPLFSLAAAMMLNFAAPMVQAQESREPLRIGYVNIDRLTRDTELAKAAQARLQAEFGKRDRELNDALTKLKAAQEKLFKDGPTLQQSERDRRERDLFDQDRDLARKRRVLSEEFTQRQNDEYKAVMEQADKALRQLAEKEKYDLIIQDAVFVGPRIDITEKLIRVLNSTATK